MGHVLEILPEIIESQEWHHLIVKLLQLALIWLGLHPKFYNKSFKNGDQMTLSTDLVWAVELKMKSQGRQN